MTESWMIAGEVASALGENTIFILLCLAGFLLAKKRKAAWALYAAGIAFQALSFSGKRVEMAQAGHTLSLADVISFALAAIVAIVFFLLILKRRKNSTVQDAFEKNRKKEDAKQSIKPTDTTSTDAIRAQDNSSVMRNDVQVKNTAEKDDNTGINPDNTKKADEPRVLMEHPKTGMMVSVPLSKVETFGKGKELSPEAEAKFERAWANVMSRIYGEGTENQNADKKTNDSSGSESEVGDPPSSRSEPNIIEQRTADDESINAIADKTSEADEIRKYKGLLDDGIITQEEFEAKKKQLLGL